MLVLTFTGVPSSIVHAGGIPLYVECNSEYVIDIEDLKRKVVDHPDANFFVLSYMRGHIPDLAAVKNICDRAGIYLLEDCAHSLGAEWDGNLVRHHGKIACFSTQSYKLLNSGEGGLIATNNPQFSTYCIVASGAADTEPIRFVSALKNLSSLTLPVPSKPKNLKFAPQEVRGNL